MTTERRKVFVLEKAERHGDASATSFGDLHYIYKSGERKPSVWTQKFITETLVRLDAAGFNPDLDYLLINGQQVPQTLLSCWMVARYGDINLLLFDAREEEYVHKTIVVDELAKEVVEPAQG